MIKIDYNIIENNLKKFRPNDYIVIKSNAYGFGFKEVLSLAIKNGFYKFCVIDINEAIYIKRNYPKARVLLLGCFDIHCLEEYEKYDIELSINSVEDIFDLVTLEIKVQIKINSGMNRFGIVPEDFIKVLELIRNSKIILTGIYSHNATKDSMYIKSQKEAFYYAAKHISNVDIHFSASSLLNEKIKFANCVRVGESIYKNALTVFGKIIKINYLKKDDYVGYDYSYKMKKDSCIGIIDIGYADGLERNCNGFLVYTKRGWFHLVGKACMNYCFILVDESVEIGDLVYFIDEVNDISNYRNFFGKINHEIYLRFNHIK